MTVDDMVWLDGAALWAIAQSGILPSPLTGTPVLGIDLDATEALKAPQRERLWFWLHTAGCAVIGLGEGDPYLADACDVVLESPAAAAPLLATIAQAPLASATAVQLLRRTEGLALEAALHAESLAYASLQAGPEYARWLADHRRRPVVVEDCGPAVVMTREHDHLRLRLNRASRRNAMSVEMRDALLEALALVAADDSIRRVDLDALGPCFSTGGDLDEFGTAPDPVTGHLVRCLALPGRALAECAERVRIHVHGACVGSGIEFPAFAARVSASPDAWFQLPELGFGLIPGAGGCVSIPRRIGRQRTAWMMLSRARVDAHTAKAWGLVDVVRAARA
ncbi:MAG: enoyl-CoA hydratase/isomerase family protein [Algiphilus sp.]